MNELRESTFITNIHVPILPGTIQMRAQAANEQSNIGPEATSIGMNFIEHQETTTVVRENILAVCWSNQQILEHYIVREENVRRVVAE